MDDFNNQRSGNSAPDYSPDRPATSDSPAPSQPALNAAHPHLTGIYLGDIVLSGVGYHHPNEVLTNDELVTAYNRFADQQNALNQELIEKNLVAPLAHSSADFIEKASGIRTRYVRDKSSMLDISKMHPEIPERKDDELSLQAEVAIQAAKAALRDAGTTAEHVDAVILASSHKQRDFPSVSVEIQMALGINGFAFDMGMACSSATFGIQTAYAYIRSGLARSILVVSPEIKSGQVCMTDRDSNFIFGEATSAVLVERADHTRSTNCFRIKDISLKTQFSNNIRNNRGAYNNCSRTNIFDRDKFFYQKGRSVYKEITTLVPVHIAAQLEKFGIAPSRVKRFWLHQSNLKMNKKIVATLIGEDADFGAMAPTILHEYGNTSSSGSIVTFALHRQGFESGELGIICSFGAGYSIGCVLIEKV